MKSFIISLFTIASFVMTAGISVEGASRDNEANEPTVSERVDEFSEDTAKNVKEGARAVEDAVCMEGDVECAMQRAENEAKNIGDEIEDKADDVNKATN